MSETKTTEATKAARARSWIRRAAGYLLFQGMLTVLAVVGFLWFSFDDIVSANFINPVLQDMRSRTAAQWPSIDRDLRLVSAHPFYRQERRGKDAGARLNSELDWTDGQGSTTRLSVPEAVRKRLKGFGAQWAVQRLDNELAGYDSSWIRSLREYSFWDAHPVAFGSESDLDPLSVAFPIRDSSDAAKLYLLAAAQSGNLAEARADVRHLAWLAFTTNTAFGAALSVGLLRIEKAAFEAHPGESARGVPPIEAEVVDAAHRSIIAVTRQPFLMLDEGGLAQVLASTRDSFARCLVVDSALWALSFRPALQKRLRANFTALTEYLRTHEDECHLGWLREAWETGRPSVMDPMAHPAIPGSPLKRMALRAFSYTPGVREPLHMVLIVISAPNPFQRYERSSR